MVGWVFVCMYNEETVMYVQYNAVKAVSIFFSSVIFTGRMRDES